MQIRTVPTSDPLVQQALERVWAQAPLVAMSGFGGDRADVVACYAVALDGGLIVALGSLAPTDEEGGPGPHIIAVWAEAELISSAGADVIRALAGESLRRYNSTPTLIAVTPEEALAARAALSQGVMLRLIDQSRLGLSDEF